MITPDESRARQSLFEDGISGETAKVGGWFALVSMSLILIAIGLDLTVLNVALPSLAVDLKASSTDLQWFIDSYALVMAAMLLPAGKIGDRLGARNLILVSVVLFSVASMSCAYAPSALWLILGRGLLGAAAGIFMPVSMSLLTRMFKGSDRSRAISVWTAAIALGIPVGPLLGGWLLDHFWWGSVFLINVPLSGVAFLALIATLPSTDGDRSVRVDGIGIVLSSLAFLALTYGFTHAGDYGWAEVWTITLAVLGTASMLALGLWLRRSSRPLFSLRIFEAPHFLWGSVMATVASLVMMTTIFIVPQFAQLAYKTNAFGLGLRLLPFIGGLVVAVPVGSVGIKRVGYKAVIAAGFVVMAVATVLATKTATDSPQSFFVMWSTLAGASVGLTLPNSMDLAMSVMDTNQSGVGSGIIQSMRQLGGTMGVAVLGSLLVGAYRDRLELTGVPSRAAAAVRSSPTMGAVVAREAQRQMPALLTTVQDSFLTGMARSFWGMALIALVAAALAIWKVPSEPGIENVEGHTGGL